MTKTILLTVIGALLVAPAADAALPASERQILVDFYEAANGDDWHRNDGWLQSGTNACEWYGVECEYRWDIDRDVLAAVELPDNNLTGTLDTRIFEAVHERLDLSGNRISGSLDVMPASPSRVDLSGNRIGGELPAQVSQKASDATGTGYQSGNWYLDLSDNAFTGEVPESWNGPYWLDLSNNDLEGLPTNLLTQPGHPLGGKYLNLADNRFSGEIPAEAMEALYVRRHATRWGGGLNLCWNDFEVDNPVVADWLAQVHVGGDYEQCLSQQRQPLDPTVSGSWYHPLRSGEGVVAHLLDTGEPMLYWFTHDAEGRQRWLFQIGRGQSNAMTWPELLETRGRFGSGLAEATAEQPAIETRASFRLDRIGDDRMIAERVMIEESSSICLSVYPPPLNCFGDSYSDRLEYQRLSQLAGTDCEPNSDYRQYSGAWYNPERSGEGFLIEVLSDTRALVYWFTYEPDDSGQQAWMVGEGRIGAVADDPGPLGISVSRVIQPVGGGHGADFDPQLVQQVDWGSLEIVFDNSNTGQLSYDSHLDRFGSGDYPIERLARPLLPDCE